MAILSNDENILIVLYSAIIVARDEKSRFAIWYVLYHHENWLKHVEEELADSTCPCGVWLVVGGRRTDG